MKNFLFGGIHCGIKNGRRKDLGIIFAPEGAKAFGFFTSNQIKSEVVERAENILKRKNDVKAVAVVSGNAMCRYIGVEKDCKKVVRKIKDELRKRGVRAKDDDIILLATGKIGSPLNTAKVLSGIPSLFSSLSEDEKDFSEAILTTDTKKKVIRYRGEGFSILGIAKGAGMIFPRFSEATTLSFIISDTQPPRSKKRIFEILSRTIGSVNIDSSTSTNDTCLFLFSGEKRVGEDKLLDGISYVLSHLAVKIAEDGEGAKHVVKLRVVGAVSPNSARRIAEAVSHSPLFKASVAGETPDVGRILSAVGSTGEKIGKVKVVFSDEFTFHRYSDGKNKSKNVGKTAGRKKKSSVVIRGSKVIHSNLSDARDIMRSRKYSILIDVGAGGRGSAELLMTDLTTEYVKINLV